MNYVAPELLVEAEDMQDKSISDLKKADIYSLGLTILGLMIGTLKITQDMKTFMSLGQEMNMTVF